MSTIFKEDIIQGDIRFRDSDHSYLHVPTKTKLTPVSRVIEVVYNTKSWDGVNPDVIENARSRGVVVDRYMADYIRDSVIRISPDEASDVTERVVAAHRIWEEEFSGLPAVAQRIVYSLPDGVAGTLDFWIDDSIVCDLKCTYNVERSWILQLGAYIDMAPSPPKRAGIIHLSPKVYLKGGQWMEYDVLACLRYWRWAVEWWQKTNGMAEELKAMRAKK